MAATILRGAETKDWTSLLEAEMWASGVIGVATAARKLGDRDPEGALIGDIANRALQRRTPGTRALLEALRRVAPSTAHAVLESALSELTDVSAPAWVVEEWRLRAAATGSDAWDDHRVHLLVYDAPVPHTVLVVEQRTLGNWVETLNVSDMDVIANWADIYGDANMVLRERPFDEVARDVAWALQRTGMTWPPQEDELYNEFAALVAARVSRGFELLELEPDWEPISDEDRAALIDDFLAYLSVDRSDDALHVADCLVDFGEGYLGGDDPLAWSPDVPPLFLDWMQRKVILDMSARARVPEVMIAWVRFALSRRGLADHAIEQV